MINAICIVMGLMGFLFYFWYTVKLYKNNQRVEALLFIVVAIAFVIAIAMNAIAIAIAT